MKLSQQYNIINQFCSVLPVDLGKLALALGVEVRLIHLGESLSGMLENKGNDRFVITANADHSQTRRRFTIAHELGHYMLHRHLIGDGIDDNKAYRSTEGGRYHNMDIGPKQETEANKFAANILMPAPLLSEQREIHGDNAKELSLLFNVSEQSMRIRLGK